MADQFEAWNTIASSFDATRNRTWAHVDAFLDGLPTGARVLDVMCGNGRHLRAGMVGLDWSQGLVRRAGGVQGDATRLPFVDGAFDGAIYVAGLHGIPDRAGRLASLRELRRVVHGPVQVTVWSRHAPRFAEATEADVIVPWRRDGHDVARTYHLYDEASLEADCRAAGWPHVDISDVTLAADRPDNLVARLRPTIPR